MVQTMIDEFKDMLDKLASNKDNNFHLVDTTKTIAPNTNFPDGWANELHPYTPGFTQLAEKFLAVLKHQFKGRI